MSRGEESNLRPSDVAFPQGLPVFPVLRYPVGITTDDRDIFRERATCCATRTCGQFSRSDCRGDRAGESNSRISGFTGRRFAFKLPRCAGSHVETAGIEPAAANLQSSLATLAHESPGGADAGTRPGIRVAACLHRCQC